MSSVTKTALMSLMTEDSLLWKPLHVRQESWVWMAYSILWVCFLIPKTCSVLYVNQITLFIAKLNSGSWWWTRRPGVLRFMGSQRVGHDWVTELNWIEPSLRCLGHTSIGAWIIFIFMIWILCLEVWGQRQPSNAVLSSVWLYLGSIHFVASLRNFINW